MDHKELKLVITRCHGLQAYSQYFVVVVQIVVSGELDVMRRHVASQFSEVLPALMIMRTYALYERSRGVLALLLGVAIGVIIVACVCLP